MRQLAISGACLLGLLTGCTAATSPASPAPAAVAPATAAPGSASSATTYAQFQSDVSLAFATLSASANLAMANGQLSAAEAARVQAAKQIAGTEVQAFGATVAPSNVAAALVDLQMLAAALPAGSVSTDAKVALAVAQGSWAAYQALHPTAG